MSSINNCLKRVAFTDALARQWLTTGNEIHARCIKGIPDDAEYMYSYVGRQGRVLYMVFYHPDFEYTSEHTDSPVLEVEFEKAECQKV